MDPRTELGNQKKPEKPKNEEDEETERLRRRVPVRVHDIIIIRGNIRIKDTVIESEMAELFRGATTFQELRHAAAVAEKRLRGLGRFESVNVRVDASPPDLPGTANFIVQVSEPSDPFAKVWGDIWDASGLGVFMPRFEAFRSPFSARLTLLPEDWLNFYSYKEGHLGYSLCMLSSGNHDLSHNFNCRSLPQVMGGPGHSLFSALKYSYKLYPRVPPLRPTGGFEFLSTTQICSISNEPRILRFIRQDMCLHRAIPLGFGGAELKLAVSAGLLFSYSVQGGLRARDLAEPRRVLRDIMNNGFWGLPVGASAHLSFDLPLKVLRDAGIHGHVSASTSGMHNLTENGYRGFSLQVLKDSLQHDVGVGVTIPTRLFRVEVKCCHTLPDGPDQGKTGIEFSFSRQ